MGFVIGSDFGFCVLGGGDSQFKPQKMKNQSVNVCYLGVEIEVNGNYSPKEPMVMYCKDGSGYPGSSSEFEVLAATIGGQNAEEIIEKLNAWDDLKELARQKIDDDEMY